MPRKPAFEASLGPSGRALWDSVVTDYELEEHELALLREACRTVDLLDGLAAIAAADGLVVDGGKAGPKTHPALVEARQLKIALARLLAALRLPSGEAGDHQASARPQRRVGPRGVYRVGGPGS